MSDTSSPPSPTSVTEQVLFADSIKNSDDTTTEAINGSKVIPGKLATEHFENEYYDEYDFYNFTPESKLFRHASGKGRSKKEASQHSSRPSQWGILAKFENESNNRKKQARARSISK